MAFDPVLSLRPSGGLGLPRPLGGFEPEAFLRPGLGLDEVCELKASFELLGPDEEGLLDLEDVLDTLGSLRGQPRLEQEPLVLALRACQRKGPTADFEALVEEFAPLVAVDTHSHEGLRRAWKFLNEERKSSIRGEDLARVSEKFCLGLSSQEIADMIEHADRDGDGEVTFDELSSLLRPHVA